MPTPAVQGPAVETAESRAERAARERLQGAAGADFEVLERIGRGGFADVYRAIDRRLGRSVALKVPRPDLHVTPDALERFVREARNIAALRHPHILPIHAIAGAADLVFLVLALVEGESLERRLEREPRASIDETVRVLRETASALAAAHRAGIVHRDIKPANVLLDGPERRVQLTDFGIARAMGGEDLALTRTGTFVGTPHYLSPEQAAGDEADHRADLYSLGVVGYRLLTGVLPFDGPVASVLVQHLTKAPRPIRELRPDCPDWLADALHRCLAKSPEERWATGEELVAAVEDRRAAPVIRTTAEPAAGEGGAAARKRAAAFRRAVAANGGVAAAALGLDLLATGTLTISVPIVLACAAVVALRVGRLRAAGHRPLALLRGDEVTGAGGGSEDAEELGRHAAALRRMRHERTALVRELSDLSNAERSRLRSIVPAADQVVARVTGIVRRLDALDERIGARRGESRAGGATRPTRLVDEMLAARALIAEELSQAEAELDALRERVRRAARASDASDQVT